MDAFTRAKFKVKIRSLAEEARIIRHLSKKHGGKWASTGGLLRQHNIDVVRPEQRATQLAYAFLRGVKYKAVDRDAKTSPFASSVARVCRSLGVLTGEGRNANEHVILAWMKGDEPCGRQQAFNPGVTGSTPVSPP